MTNVRVLAQSSLTRPQVVGVLAAVLLGSTLRSATGAEDWPSWRGPRGTGSVPSGSIPSQWTTNTVAWKAELPGKGGSTPIVVGQRVILTCPSGGEDAVLAFDTSGKRLWSTSLGPESSAKHRTLGSSCNASPVSDGTLVFVSFKSGHFAALDMSGAVKWKTHLVERFGAEKLYWDAGSSPVVSGDQVILARLHGGESWVAGFDKATGALRWRAERDFEAPSENDNGYATPVLVRHDGRDAFLLWGADRLTAHEAKDGALLWTAGGFNPGGKANWPAIATPVISGDIAVVPVGRDDRPGQASLYGVRLGGRGDVTESHRVWAREDLGVFVTTPAEDQGRVYLLRHRGEVVCVNAGDGAVVWSDALPKGSAPYYASPLVVNGVLYAAREDGVVFVARVREKFEVLGENPMGERIVATPVASGNRLLLRGDRHLLCVGGG
ncbi:MAG: PQQ-binding-like beta-propeller repeat protein [Verrucomicrobiales bacterium]|nr:PQQ-binding-like beta-propeller repeat protein [Verrucomicrobiales bacterium]